MAEIGTSKAAPQPEGDSLMDIDDEGSMTASCRRKNLRGDSSGQEKNYRVNLLKISHFLSSFQKSFAWPDNDEKEKESGEDNDNDDMSFVITPSDIENAMKYRYLVLYRQQLLDYKNTEGRLGRELVDGPDGKENNCSPNRHRYNEESKKKAKPKGKVLNKATKQRLKELLEDVDIQLAERSQAQTKRDRRIHQMLERFQVWATKDLAHSLLMPSCGCQNLHEATVSCWSKLLGIPGAVHFFDQCPEPKICGPPTTMVRNEESTSQKSVKPTMPETEFSELYGRAHVQKKTHPMCSLVLPPNSYTWEEFARLSEMVSFLPTDENRQAAEESPCCGTLQTMIKYKKMSANAAIRGLTIGSPRRADIYSKDFVFQPHDLVALWVRAQRSAVATRHLIQLFCRPSQEELAKLKQRGKDSEDDAQSVIFRGNHKTTKNRVMGESRLVKKLIEWAVVNQVMFHFQYMQGQLERQIKAAEELPKKRPLSDSNDNPPKRPRLEETATKSDPEAADPVDPQLKLLRASYQFLLRWFGRRNHPLVATLFYVKMEQSPVSFTCHGPSVQGFLERCKAAGVTEEIHRRLKDLPEKGGVERSLSRIDRRVSIGKYDVDLGDLTTSEPDSSPFYKVVRLLLRFWSEVLTLKRDEIGVDLEEVHKVVTDFEALYNEFHRVLIDDGVTAAAKSLLGLSNVGIGETITDKEIIESLLGTPPPWNESCRKCGKPQKKHVAKEDKSNEFIACANCDRAFSVNCVSPSTFFFRKDMTQKLLPLPSFAVEMPKSELMPEFRGLNGSGPQVQWTDMTMLLTRAIDERGNMEGAGLELRQTNASRDAMDYVISKRLDLAALFGDEFREEFPIGFSHQIEGCLITDVVGEYTDANGNLKTGAGKKAGLRKDDVIVGLQFVSFASDVKDPPSKTAIWDFQKLSKDSRIKLLKVKSTVLKLFIKRPDVGIVDLSQQWIEVLREHNQFMWKLANDCSLLFCESCRGASQALESAEKESQADRLRGAATTCRAVIRRIGMESYAEPFFDDGPAPGTFVSLRRLDAMMGWIIQSNSDRQTQNEDLHNAFFSPSRISSTRDRLDWAPPELEARPLQLLVKGFGMMFQRCRAVPSHGDPLSGKLREGEALMRHFVRLVGAWCIPIKEFLRVPPPAALNSRSPWMKPSCSVCFARGSTSLRNCQPTCDDPLCRREALELTPFHDKVASFEECAALIGRTVLVHPGDPLLSFVAREAQILIEPHGRPIEFIVSFYSPPIQHGERGEFFLLPVISQIQLQYLLDRCHPLSKDAPSQLTRENLEKFISGSILALPGVVRISRRRLGKLIDETNTFFERVGAGIERFAQAGTLVVVDRMEEQDRLVPRQEEALIGHAILSPGRVTRFLDVCANQFCCLIDALVRTPTPVMKAMLDSMSSCRDSPKATFRPQREVEDLVTNICASTGQRGGNNRGLNLDLTRSLSALKSIDFCLPPESNFKILYTDLHYNSEEDKDKLESALQGQHLSVPTEYAKTEDPSNTKIVVLSRDQAPEAVDTPESYRGLGWGFECVMWSEECLMRVGRVHPQSPAARCGLRQDDVIESLGGKIVGEGFTWTLPLICESILGLPHCVKRSKDPLRVISSALKAVATRGQVSGPVVIQVYRPEQEVPSPAATVDPPEAAAVPAGEQPVGATGSSASNVALPRPATVNVPAGRNAPVAAETAVARAVSVPAAAAYSDTARTTSQTHATHNVSVAQANMATTGDLQPMPMRGPDHRAPGSAGQQPQHQHQQPFQPQHQQQPVHPQQRQQPVQPQPQQQRQPVQQQQQPVQPQIAASDESVIGAIRHLLPSLSATISTTLSRRPPFRSSNIYEANEVTTMAQGLTLVLTKVETAVFLEAVHDAMPMLGLRLLMPRYNLRTLLAQVAILNRTNRRDFEVVPRLPSELFSRILSKDYARFQNEAERPRILHDPNDRSYPLPLETLPLDRLVEILVREEAQGAPAAETLPTYQRQRQPQAPVQAIPHQEPLQELPYGHQNFAGQGHYYGHNGWQRGFPVPSNNMNGNGARVPEAHSNYARRGYPAGNYSYPYPDDDPDRIRGGGASSDAEDLNDYEEEDIPIDSLLTLPVKSWHNQPVKVKARVARKDSEPAEEFCMGRVNMADCQNIANADDIDFVPVTVCYGSVFGVFEPPIVVKYDPIKLTLLKEGDDDFINLQSAETNYLLSKEVKADKKNPQQDKPDSESQLPESVAEGADNNHHHMDCEPIDGQPAASYVASEQQPREVAMEQVVVDKKNPQQDKPDTESQLPESAAEGTDNNHHHMDCERIDGKPAASYSAPEPPQPREVATEQVAASRAAAPQRSLPNVEEAAACFASRYGRKDGPSQTFGMLPDGRSVSWFPNDPCALYIEDNISGKSALNQVGEEVFRRCVTDENQHREERLILDRQKYFCGWGCTHETHSPSGPLRLVSYPSESDLREHLAAVHSFCGEACHFTNTVDFIRVEKTETIVHLMSGLISAMCVYSASLCKTAKTDRVSPSVHVNGDMIVCSPSRYRLSLSFEDLMALIKTGPRGEKSPPLYRMAHLLVKIKFLFDVQQGPSLRLSTGAIKGLKRLEAGDQGRRDKALVASYKTPCSFNPRSRDRSSNEKSGGYQGCSLCVLRSENTLEHHTHPRYCCGRTSREDPGYLDFAKNLLLRTINEIPAQMHDDLGRLRQQMWKKEGKVLRRFIVGSTSILQVTQAFVVLLASVEHDGLPVWWQESWSESTQTLLLTPSKSALILHIQMFILALAKCNNFLIEAKPLRTLVDDGNSHCMPGLPVKERLRAVLDAAAKNSIPRFDGVHDSYCLVCDDGGDLICCEFCEKVIHKKCWNQHLDKDPEDWICGACTVDITELANP